VCVAWDNHADPEQEQNIYLLTLLLDDKKNDCDDDDIEKLSYVTCDFMGCFIWWFSK